MGQSGLRGGAPYRSCRHHKLVLSRETSIYLKYSLCPKTRQKSGGWLPDSREFFHDVRYMRYRSVRINDIHRDGTAPAGMRQWHGSGTIARNTRIVEWFRFDPSRSEGSRVLYDVRPRMGTVRGRRNTECSNMIGQTLTIIGVEISEQ